MRAALLRNPRPRHRWWRIAYTVTWIIPSWAAIAKYGYNVVRRTGALLWEAWWGSGEWSEHQATTPRS